MFRLNRLTDYAVVVMSQMAHQRDRVRTALQISQESGLPLPTVAKLLNALARDGLITSQRGASGGYILSRPAGEISVAAIIQALEGPIALTACVTGSDEHCDVASLCPMHGNWNKVNGAIRAALDAVTLADMAMTPLDFSELPASPKREASAATG
ncbi:MAG: SUF system Fe-S cluster assembly regulator [Kiloniellales bacterium]